MDITSLQHPIVKHLVRLRQNRDYRHEQGTVLIEGKKLVTEICLHQQPEVLLTSDASLIPASVNPKNAIVVPPAMIQKISGLQQSEGILAEMRMPKEASLDKCRFIIALDAISDPGNLGTLLRTALALGWEGAYLLPNTCDPYNEKALRAAKGATFKLPLFSGSWKQLSELVKDNRLTPYVADLNGLSLNDLTCPENALLVLNNESTGPSQEALQQCQKITIPMPGNMESLNVSIAGAIIMYSLKR